MTDYSPHQKRIIRNYYDNRETLMLQKLGELLSDLYLAQGNAKKEQGLWVRIEKALDNLEMPGSVRNKVLETHDLELLASIVNHGF